MKVTIMSPGAEHSGTVPGAGLPTMPEAPVASDGGWRPARILGADSPGGLALPPAYASAATMYAPRAAWTDGERVIAVDTGNHRILIWLTMPEYDGKPADIVLGQPDALTEGPAANGRGPANGLHLPTGVLVDRGRLIVADAWHHRVLIWDQMPTATDTPPDRVLGQSGIDQVAANRGGDPTASTFYWPFGIALIDGRFYVADTGNRRVLVWRDGLPEADQPADLIVGQSAVSGREENRGGEVAADSFRWPHSIAGTGDGGLLVADAGNHRVLRWARHPDGDCPADGVIGQTDFETGIEFPYVSQAGRLRFPYALASSGHSLAIADTANNRILLFDSTSTAHHDLPQAVLGQPTLAANGENRWSMVAPDSLCWPYGLHWHRAPSGVETLAVADSGNNRIVLWERA